MHSNRQMPAASHSPLLETRPLRGENPQGRDRSEFSNRPPFGKLGMTMTPAHPVFISSPGDVKKERLRASLVIDKLTQDYGRFFSTSKPIFGNMSRCCRRDIFRTRSNRPTLSTLSFLSCGRASARRCRRKLALREYRGLDGRAPVTGTEWELRTRCADRPRREACRT